MLLYPKISVVTPSFNQAAFIEETINSVLSQKYSNLEYIIIDGGSTDGSVEIIKKYSKYLAFWESVPDRGQAHALNKGFAKASGDIYCWLCSDDLLEPGALVRVAEAYQSGTQWIIGQCLHFGGDFQPCVKPLALPGNPAEWLMSNVPQPSVFWSSDLHRKAGMLREDLHYVFDWEFWLRFVLDIEIVPRFIPSVLSHYRFHNSSKSVAHAFNFIDEADEIRAKRLALLTPDEKKALRLSARNERAQLHLMMAWKDRGARRCAAALSHLWQAILLGATRKDLRPLFFALLLPGRIYKCIFN
jgi:glycosyltransferase involved in cell wall biosynthesis